MTHTHLTTIALTLILFFIAITLQKKGKNIRVIQMILRVMYLFIILTGGILIFTLYKITLLYVLKVVFGIAMIGLIETILSLNNKGKKLAGFWIPFVIISILTVYLGVTLPMGMYF